MNREERIAEYRQSQPIEELERKFKKIEHSRHRRVYWTAEELDLAKAEAKIWNEFFNPSHPNTIENNTGE